MLNMIHTKIYIYNYILKIHFVLEDTSETMLAELHHFLENNFGNLISIRAIQQGSLVIVCNLLNEWTQLFISALRKIQCCIKDVKVSLYYTNYDNYL